MLLLNGGNMFRQKNKKLQDKLFVTEKELEWAKDVIDKQKKQKQEFFYEKLEAQAKADIFEKKYEEQKEEAAKYIALYYDTIQKLKTIMEETNYGQDL